MSIEQSAGTCDAASCGCGPTRRDAIKTVAIGIAAAMIPRMTAQAMAGPFIQADFDHLVPSDKKLSEAWLRSLTQRGTPAVYRGRDLKYIGMPVGGITTGQLYLGGDGRLWHWDIFNSPLERPTDDKHYAHPMEVESNVEQKFTLRLLDGSNAPPRPLSMEGFPDVSFSGQYPIGTVEYRDAGFPLAVTLEAFSPFLPLNVDDSSLPATVMRFTVANTSGKAIEAELCGSLENAVARSANGDYEVNRRNKIIRSDGTVLLECTATGSPRPEVESKPPIVFADFEGKDYSGWTVEGNAFGIGPSKGATVPDQKLAHFQGTGLANSLLDGSDLAKGRLTSAEFTIGHRYIHFLIAGGKHANETCMNLLLAGKPVRTQTGKNSDDMQWATWDVNDLAGKTAKIEIVDQSTGAWGHIEVDQIEFSDARKTPLAEYAKLRDAGDMGLALLSAIDGDGGVEAIKRDDGKVVGALTRKVSLAAGQTQVVTFVLVWRFPNLTLSGIKGSSGRHYAAQFDSSAAVAKYVVSNFDRLFTQTKLWRDTWYDSTLPHWFLDRTFLNASILATSTAYRFSDGRFYGWEGVGCCQGTCTHVWQYEQAMGRLFPMLDVLLRERADFNPDISFKADGMIDHRGEFHAGHAIDGQAGTILRCLRDHQTSTDDSFLKRNWPSIKKATQWLIGQDGNGDGILEGAQHNTLDAEWYGPVAWLSGMYLASLRAAEELAKDAGDADFAAECRRIFEPGVQNFVKLLFDVDYFINKPDPKHPNSINSGTGCEIDQVLGQSWAFQVGLGRVLPEKETRAALASLWKYNFSPDVGPYREANKPGRWYAMPGEAGLLMCSFPRTDWDFTKAKGTGRGVFAGYFNECMNGFEHQAAGHMIWENMLTEGLAVERAVHDRYHPSRRNPWNEIECGDHYARSMASYGVFLAACGFQYHGPKGHIAFAPRLSPENFRSAFTTAAGWGTFSQQIDGKTLRATLDVRSGALLLTTIALTPPADSVPEKVTVKLGDSPVSATSVLKDGRVNVRLGSKTSIVPGTVLSVVLD